MVCCLTVVYLRVQIKLEAVVSSNFFLEYLFFSLFLQVCKRCDEKYETREREKEDEDETKEYCMR